MNILFKRLMETPPSDGSAGGQTGAPTGDTSASAPSSPDAGKFESPDFSELADWDESLELADDDGTPAPAPGASAQPTTVVVPPAAPTPAPVVPPPAAPVVTTPPAAPAVVPPQVAGTPPAPGTQPPAAASAPASTEPPTTIEQHRARALPELEKLYQLTPEELEEFQVNPTAALPKLASKLHFEVVMSAYQAVASQLPMMVQGFMNHDRTVQQSNDAFFGKWPDLKGDTHLEQVKASIKAYKAANPNATQEQVINGAGAMVMISLGKNPFAQAQQQPQVGFTPSRPAGIGSTGAPMPQNSAQPTNEIDALVAATLAGEID